MEEREQKALIEAALFMAPEPMSLHDLTKIIEAPTFATTAQLIETLIEEFNGRNQSLEIIKTANSKFQMRVRDEYLKRVSHLAVATDISKAVLRTLGLIAVKQPVRQSFVVRVVGNKAYDYVKELQEKGFIKAQKAGTTKLLTTTPQFEAYFGKRAEEIKSMSQ
jgi:segregation and condensation protein B